MFLSVSRNQTPRSKLYGRAGQLHVSQSYSQFAAQSNPQTGLWLTPQLMHGPWSLAMSHPHLFAPSQGGRRPLGGGREGTCTRWKLISFSHLSWHGHLWLWLHFIHWKRVVRCSPHPSGKAYTRAWVTEDGIMGSRFRGYDLNKFSIFLWVWMKY